MNFKNNVEITGIVTGTPDLRKVGTRSKCVFSVLTKYAYHKNGIPVIEETYHRVHVWESATIPEMTLRKVVSGSKVHVTGRHRTLEHLHGERKSREEIVQASKLTVLRQSEPLLCDTQL